MGDYEGDEHHVEALMNDFFSDEESDECSWESYNGSDLDYVSSDSDSSVPAKRAKVSKTGRTETIAPRTSTAESIEQTINDVIRKYCSDSSLDETPRNADLPNLHSVDTTGDGLKDCRFVINPSVIMVMKNKQPIDFFKMFVDEEVLNLMVVETNKYAVQKLIKAKGITWKWKETHVSEMKVFLGLQIWLSLVQMPKLQCYWSDNVLYATDVQQVMSMNRFELLLNNWHFTNNEDDNTSESLYKITPLLNLLRDNFQEVVTPSSDICLDEIIVPFRGRLAFRQYLKNNELKFGIKMFKLCIEDGYTYNFKLSCVAEKFNTNDSVPTPIVMELCENLLDRERTIYAHNCYISSELAHKLLSRRTHLVGILRENDNVTRNKLEKDKVISIESESGDFLIKWCDKRKVLMLSTKHTDNTKSITSENINEVQNLKVDYNKSKRFIDLSKQVKAYTTCLQKNMKWYRKLAVEILLGSAVINAFIIYKRVTDSSISIREFREEIAKDLLGISQVDNKVVHLNRQKHTLNEVNYINRRRCVGCYERLAKVFDRQYARLNAKQTRWKCVECEKFYCVNCFTLKHKCTL